MECNYPHTNIINEHVAGAASFCASLSCWHGWKACEPCGASCSPERARKDPQCLYYRSRRPRQDNVSETPFPSQDSLSPASARFKPVIYVSPAVYQTVSSAPMASFQPSWLGSCGSWTPRKARLIWRHDVGLRVRVPSPGVACRRPVLSK